MARILSLMPYHVFPPQTGGQKAIFSFTKALAESHDVIAVSTNLNTNPEKAPFELLNFFGPTRWRYFNILDVFKVYQLCKRKQIEYLITDHPYYGWQAYVLKKLLNIPCYVRSHNIEYQRFKSLGNPVWRILYLYERWVYRFADTLFCITDEDRDFARKQFNLSDEHCQTLAYGIPYQNQPSTFPVERKIIQEEQNIPDGIPILLFNGALDHKANQQALEIILYQINPEIKKRIHNYRIIICGRRMPDYIKNLPEKLWENIIYTGFVDDIDLYIKGADVHINPIISGGGVKTKVIEALGYSKPVISFFTGAVGVKTELCENKLFICDDNDFLSFVDLIQQAIATKPTPCPQKFYEYYFLENIIAKMDQYFN